MPNHSTINLTPEEIANGWTAESLAAYRRDRDQAFDVVAGNVVTEFKRGKPAIQIQGVQSYSPFTRQVR